MRDIKDNLEQEADFWRTMQQECPDPGSTKCQRMHEALLLAEYKLAQMTALSRLQTLRKPSQLDS